MFESVFFYVSEQVVDNFIPCVISASGYMLGVYITGQVMDRFMTLRLPGQPKEIKAYY